MASILPEDVRRAVGAATGGGTPAPPQDPRAPAAAAVAGIPGPKPTITRDSDPVLARHGFTGSIKDFNERVKAATEAAETRIGYRPQPGLIFDLVRSPLEKERFPDLFGNSPSKRANAAETVLAAAGAPASRRAEDQPGTFERLGAAAERALAVYGVGGPTLENQQRISELEAWLKQPGNGPDNPAYEQVVNNLQNLKAGFTPVPQQPMTSGWLQEAGAAIRAAGGATDRFVTEEIPSFFGAVKTDITDGTKVRLGASTYSIGPAAPKRAKTLSEAQGRGILNEASLVPAALLGTALEFTKLTIDQLATAAILMPVGFYTVLKAPVMDLVVNPIGGDWSFKETREIADVAVSSTVDMLRNPLDNPGNLILLGWGAASGLAGAASRAGVAAEILQTEGLGASTLARAGLALAKKPKPQVFHLGNEYVNLSENAAFRVLQRHYLTKTGKKLEGRIGPSGVPHATRDGWHLYDFVVHRTLSAEATLGRAAKERVKAEFALSTWRAHELTRMARGAEKAQRVMGDLMQDSNWRTWFKARRSSEAIGIQRIIWTAANDGGTDLRAALRGWIDTHGRYRDDAESIAAKYDTYKLEVDRSARIGSPQRVRQGFAAKRVRQNVITGDYVRRSQSAQIKSIEYALRVLDEAEKNPKKWAEIERAINYARATSKEGEWEKISGWGLPMDVAIRRTAAVGAIGRGEAIFGIPDVRAWLHAEIDLVQDQVAERGIPATRKLGKKQAKDLAAGKEPKTSGSGEIVAGRLEPQTRLAKLDIDKDGRFSAARLERLQDALDDPRVDGPDGVQVLRELGVPFTGEPLPLKPIDPDAFYVKVARAPWGTDDRGINVPLGPNGLRIPIDAKMLPELQHRFTGAAIEIGDFRIDATNLVAESYRSVIRAGTIRNEYQRLWQMASTRRGPHSIPIRNIESINADLRGLMQRVTDEGEVMQRDASALDDGALSNVLAQIFPSGEIDPRTGRFKFTDRKLEHDSNIRWIDERFLFSRGGEDYFFLEVSRALAGERGVVSQTLGKGWAVTNEGIRAGTLFLRPAYALNMLGNASFNLVTQGYASPGNWGRSLWSPKLYGEEVTYWLDFLGGETRTASYLPSKRTSIATLSQKASDLWTPITDAPFRRAQVLYRLREIGIKSKEDMIEAMRSTEPEVRRNVRLAAKRARKDMVDFNNLNPFERSVMRNLVFIYAWWSRSAVWSATFVRDHPIQAQVYAWAGEATEDELDEVFGKVPEIVKRMGFFHAGMDDDRGDWMRGYNFLLATTAWVEMGRPLVGLFDGTSPKRDAVTEILGPSAKFVVRMASGRDDFGREYEDGAIRGPVGQMLSETPIGALVRRNERRNEAEAPPLVQPLDIADTRARGELSGEVIDTGEETLSIRAGELPSTGLIAQEQRALELTMFKTDSFMDVWGPWLFGALVDRYPNKEYLNAKFWTEQGDEERHRHEVELIKEGVKQQATLLDREIPPQILTAVDYVSEVTWRWRNASAEQGPGGDTLRTRAGIAVATLKDMGLLDADEVKLEQQRLADVDSGDELKVYLKRLSWDYAGGRQVHDWVMDVRTVTQFRKPGTIEGFTEKMADWGMGDYRDAAGASEAAKDEYGRGFLDYLKERNGLEELADADAHPELTNDDRAGYRRRMQVLDSEYAEPVVIEGSTFPSYAETRWALRAPEQEQEWVEGALKREWGDLSTWEKKALTGREQPDLGEAWAGFNDYVARQRDLAQTEGITLDSGRVVRSVGRDLEAFYAGQVDAKYPGFLRDWKLAEQPRVRRLVSNRYFASSPEKAGWYEIFARAEQYAKYLEENQRLRDAGEFDSRDRWLDGEQRLRWEADAKAAYEKIRSVRPALYAEVDRYGGVQFLMDLLD